LSVIKNLRLVHKQNFRVFQKAVAVVAQYHPSQEQKILGSNPACVLGFKG
jgi:hypothetical protein